MSIDPQEETLRFLTSLDDGDGVSTTHISHVVLGRSRAFKLKRAVAFPYLDFSTAQKRLAMCEREVALNQRTAKSLYLGAHRITRATNGGLELDGAGELVDAVVEMRRFDDQALLDKLAAADRLTPEIVEALARRIAAFHDQSAIVRSRGGLEAMSRVVDLTEVSLREAPPAPKPALDEHVARLRQLLQGCGPLLDARHSQGKTRHCHGDLTLRNICMFEGAPTPFDCLEFSDELASIDVLYDLAFLLMDLCRVGQRALANLSLNRYLDWRDETDGLPSLPFFLSLRATIRAYVAAEQQNAAEAEVYFEFARSLTRYSLPCVVAVGGYSGSGKSSVAAALAPRLGVAPGARTINSDRLRKKLFGVEPTQRLPPEAYFGEVSTHVYAQMREQAARVATAGWPVVVDAVFDLPESRAEIEKIARDAGVPYFGFWLNAGLDARLARVDIRRGDPSDATRDVLLHQMQRDPGEMRWKRIDAARDLDTIVREIAQFVS
jgi:aminoglycoside phosphotransferase family enzyme/predicted kinase